MLAELFVKYAPKIQFVDYFASILEVVGYFIVLIFIILFFSGR